MKNKKDRKNPINKVSVCVDPYKRGCKGCKYNNSPDLFDGGCMLLDHKHAEAPKRALE